MVLNKNPLTLFTNKLIIWRRISFRSLGVKYNYGDQQEKLTFLFFFPSSALPVMCGMHWFRSVSIRRTVSRSWLRSCVRAEHHVPEMLTSNLDIFQFLSLPKPRTSGDFLLGADGGSGKASAVECQTEIQTRNVAGYQKKKETYCNRLHPYRLLNAAVHYDVISINRMLTQDARLHQLLKRTSMQNLFVFTLCMSGCVL